MEWLHEPSAWRVDGDTLVATAAPRTDFWRATKYGVIRDNGHVYGVWVAGDAIAEVTVRGGWATQYDQAGLALRLSETTWLKCGVELVDGVPQAAVVVTRDFSDWSIVPLPRDVAALRLRLVRQGSAVEIYAAVDEAPPALLRLAYLPEGRALLGPMIAAPGGDGFTATFSGIAVRPG